MNPLWVGVNPLSQKSEPPIRVFYQNISSDTIKDAVDDTIHCVFYLCKEKAIDECQLINMLMDVLHILYHTAQRGWGLGEYLWLKNRLTKWQ